MKIFSALVAVIFRKFPALISSSDHIRLLNGSSRIDQELLSYQLNETTKVAFGAFYSRDLGEERVLPALGVIFEPNAHWSLALTFPRIELAYAPADDWLFTGRAVLSGAGWNITDPAGGVAAVDLNYKSVRVGVGAEHNFAGPWWAYLDAGVQLAQEIEIEGANYNFQQDLDTAAFATGGVKVRF